MKGKSKWLATYELVKQYYLKYGNINFPQQTNQKPNLYYWILRQRSDNRKGKLELWQKQLLDEVGMIWDFYEVAWQKNYQACQKFYNQYHHLNVPRNFKVDDLNIYNWLEKQKISQMNGELSIEHQKALEILEIKWRVSKVDKWARNFEKAKKYYELHGHLIVSPKEDIKLYNWIHNQLGFYRRKELSAEKIAMLESIGMIWSLSDYRWEQNYKLCKEFYEKYHHLRIPDDYSGFRCNLHYWLSTQKEKYRKKELPEDKMKLLEKLGINNKCFNSWDMYYDLAKKYYEENGNLLIPRSYKVGDIKLGKWIATQRGNKDKLSQEEIDKLNSIGMVWKVREKNSWNDSFQVLKKCFDTYGELKMDMIVYGDYTIEKWIETQHKFYRENRLSKQRIALLASVGVTFTKKYTRDVWDDMYLIAKTYYEEHGHLEVLVSSKPDGLYKWVCKQRVFRRNGDLSAEKIKLLDEIEMIWDTHEYIWQKNYSLCKEYYEEHGDLLIPKRYEVNGIYPAEWLKYQRLNRKRLSFKRIELLDKIEMIWNLNDYKLGKYQIARTDLEYQKRYFEQILEQVLLTQEMNRKLEEENLRSIEEEYIRKLG